MGQSKRRRFLIATGALLAARLAIAQQSPRRIGWLTSDGPETRRMGFYGKWASDALPRLGYEEGKNFLSEWRYAEGSLDRLPALAEELVRLKVDLIVTLDNDAAFAAKRATQTIPIVISSGQVVEIGLVKNLARPGGNITGLDWAPTTTLLEKNYQLLKEVLSTAKRVVTLLNPKQPGVAKIFNAEFDRIVTSKTGMANFRVEITRSEDLGRALDQIDSIRPDVLFVTGNNSVRLHWPRIAAFAQGRKLPSTSYDPGYASVGGLLQYAADPSATVDRLGAFIDRILRGANPGDLPIEQPTKYELVLNMKTAKAIGLTLAPAFMAQVDQVIE